MSKLFFINITIFVYIFPTYFKLKGSLSLDKTYKMYKYLWLKHS